MTQNDIHSEENTLTARTKKRRPEDFAQHDAQSTGDRRKQNAPLIIEKGEPGRTANDYIHVLAERRSLPGNSCVGLFHFFASFPGLL
jgi:hypothetical protein